MSERRNESRTRKIKILCEAFSHWTCVETEILPQHDSNLKRGRGVRWGGGFNLSPACISVTLGVPHGCKGKKKTPIKSNQSDCGTAINWWDNNDGSLPTVSQLQLSTRQRQAEEGRGREE